MSDQTPRTRRSDPDERPSAVPKRVTMTGGARPSEPSEPGVVVTGACGRLGRRVVRALHRETRVVGIDRRAFPDKPKDVEHWQVDLRRKKTQDIFRPNSRPSGSSGSPAITAVVHLGVMHDPRASAADHHSWNVAGFAKLLDYVAQYNVPKLVVLSSANVYGPHADNAQFLTEDAPLLGGQHFPEIRDLVEVDMLAQSFFWKHPETETVVLRPVHILGAVHNAPSNYLRLPVIPRLLGFDPMVQVIHEDDVVHAIRLAQRPGAKGIFNHAGPDSLPLTRMIDILGRPSFPVPHALAKITFDGLYKWRLSSFPAPELDHIRYVCMVNDQRAREELGYAPRRSLEDTIRAVDEP
ncbi:MAG: NAD-dependent epimerase/dehydratase family protein [Polyangiales bacterium]